MAIRAVVRALPTRHAAHALLLGALLAVILLGTPPVRAAALSDEPAPAFPFDQADCGPPSTTIPGPPPELIEVGRTMSDSWLMCYMKQDFEQQTYFFDRWGEARKTSFRGYPVECWTREADPGWTGRGTEGIIAELYGWNLDRTQYVRFTYRIQLDGDYINNCHQEILPTP